MLFLPLLLSIAHVHASESLELVHGIPVVDSSPIAQSVVAVVGSALGSEEICTGTLIANDLAVTAGHCKSAARVLRFGLDAHSHFIERSIDQKATRFSFFGMTNDITLVHFKGGLPLGYKVAEILKDPHLLQSGAAVVLAGYGETHNLRGDYGVLRSGSAQVDKLNPERGEVSMDERSGSGACHGDSGGPAFLNDDGRLYLFGVDSRSGWFGTCGHFEVYTNILDHAQWLQLTAAEMRAAVQK